MASLLVLSRWAAALANHIFCRRVAAAPRPHGSRGVAASGGAVIYRSSLYRTMQHDVELVIPSHGFATR
jgi:hypothetical protein